MDSAEDITYFRERIEDLSEEITMLAALLDSDIDETMFEIIEEQVERTLLHSSSGDAVPCSGRSSFDIPAESIEHLLLCGLKVLQIADLYGVSEKTITRRMSQFDIRVLITCFIALILEQYNTGEHLRKSLHSPNERKKRAYSLGSAPPYPGADDDNLFWFVQISDIHISRFYDKSRISDLEKFCTETIDAINPAIVLVTALGGCPLVAWKLYMSPSSPSRHPGQTQMQELSDLATKSFSSNLSVWFGHYTTSTIVSPSPGIREVMRYRILAFDHDLFSFADLNFEEWPAVLITNPKSALYSNPVVEPLGKIRNSTHIRVLAFSEAPITAVHVEIDGKSMGNAQPVNKSLFTLKWDPKSYIKGLHYIEVKVEARVIFVFLTLLNIAVIVTFRYVRQPASQGPWFICEVIDGHTGACFSFGVLLDGYFLEGSLTYFLGILQMVSFNLPVLCYLCWSLNHRYSGIGFLAHFRSTGLIRAVTVNLIMLGLLVWQTYSCYALTMRYGLAACVLSPARLWALLLSLFLILKAWNCTLPKTPVLDSEETTNGTAS
ncbi:TMM62 protein, partial [Polypterus senegalus]